MLLLGTQGFIRRSELKLGGQVHFQMVGFQVKQRRICRNAEGKAVILCVKRVTCKLRDNVFTSQ